MKKRGRGRGSLLKGVTDFMKCEEMWKKSHFRFCFTKISGLTAHCTSGANSGRTSDIMHLKKIYTLTKARK